MPFTNDNFFTPPPDTKSCLLSYPLTGILLVLINRPNRSNSLSVEASHELASVFEWFDQEPSFSVAVISGVGKTFCAGADLKEWMENNKKGCRMKLPESGFGGLSFRGGKKPIIAAVNGPAYGGGLEMIVNCDMIIASSTATFGLPEVKRGVTPFGGVLPRIMRTIGRQRAAEIAFTGRIVTANELKEWGLCNFVVDSDKSVVDKALEYATLVAEGSPDAIIVTREGLKLGWEALGVTDASRVFLEGWSNRIYDTANMQEGLLAFTEKRRPQWKASKL